jgi:hypothetical protein
LNATFDKSKLLNIGKQKRNKETELTWQQINEQFCNGQFADGEQTRIFVKNQLRNKGNLDSSSQVDSKSHFNDESLEFPSTYNESVDINRDGTQTSNKLVKMSLQDSKDPKFLLNAHGYDAKAWELVSARSNIWNSYSKKDGIMQMYSSKISVRPSVEGSNLDSVLRAIENVRPVYIEVEVFVPEEDCLLEIPLFDTHFGISNYEYYKSTQSTISRKINSMKWKEILFVIGQDLFHNNDFKGNTANSTHIEEVDMEKAWDDCCKFYEPLISEAIKQSINVKIMYSKGNHDETISWAFVKYLQGRFPQVEFDCTFIERKIHTFGKIFLGVTHGDKANNKDLANIFIKEFSMAWANSEVKEIHKGHYHVEDGKDYIGTMVRTLATRNKSDKWHTDKGFIGAHKRFMLFEYSETELKGISYV